MSPRALAEKIATAIRVIGGKDPSPRTAAIVVAAGASSRMGSATSKTLLTLAGKPVLAHTLLAFQQAPHITEIVVVARPEDVEAIYDIKDTYQIKKLTAVTRGGATRALSVKRGFLKIDKKTRFVAIHDGARCLITPDGIEKVLRAAYKYRAASAAAPVTDTVKLADKKGFIASTLDRDKVFLAQTPQVFLADLYRAALATVNDGEALTDDNQLIEKLGHPVKLVDTGRDNIKITHPDDLARAEQILKERKNATSEEKP